MILTKPIRPRCLVCASLIVSIVWWLPLQARFGAAAAYAQSTEPIQTANSTKPSAFTAAREGESAKVRVFDNTLLDNLFAKDRAAAKRQAHKQEAPVLDETEQKKPSPQVAAPLVPPALLLPNDSIAAKITARTPARLAAALRFAEHGRKEIKLREYRKAVNYFERAVSLGLLSYLPYIYYYLAETHYHLANYQTAINFLEVAESWLGDYSNWMTSIATLRQENSNAMLYAQAPTASRIR